MAIDIAARVVVEFRGESEANRSCELRYIILHDTCEIAPLPLRLSAFCVLALRLRESAVYRQDSIVEFSEGDEFDPLKSEPVA